MSTLHLPADRPNLAASAFRRLGSALVARVQSRRPPDFPSLPAHEQQLIDTVLWGASASAFCVAGIGLFMMPFGQWLAVGLCGASWLQLQASPWLIQRGHLTAGSATYGVWAIVLLDGFFLTTGGIESSTALWYVITASVALASCPRKYRLLNLVLVALHQLALLLALKAGWFSSAFVVDGAITNAHFNFAASPIFAGAFGFTISIGHRTLVARLREAERNTRLAMQCIVTGFLVVDRNCRLVVNSAKGIEDWLPGARTGADLQALLSRAQPAFAESFRVRFESLVDGTLPLALCLEQLPKEIVLRGRPHRLRYRAIQAVNTPWSRLIITLEDQSDMLAREAAAAERQTLAALVRSLQRDPGSTAAWVSAARKRVSLLVEDPETDEWHETIAALRSIAEEVDLGVLRRAIAEAEDAATGGARSHGARLIQAAWAQLQTLYNELVEEDRFSGVRVGAEEYAHILRLIERRAPHSLLLRRAHGWSPESTAAAIRTGKVAKVEPPKRDGEAA